EPTTIVGADEYPSWIASATRSLSCPRTSTHALIAKSREAMTAGIVSTLVNLVNSLPRNVKARIANANIAVVAAIGTRGRRRQNPSAGRWGRAQPSEEWTLSLRWWAAKETVDPITANNANASGSYIREGQYALIVRGIGLVQSTDGLGSNVGGATSDRVVL